MTSYTPQVGDYIVYDYIAAENYSGSLFGFVASDEHVEVLIGTGGAWLDGYSAKLRNWVPTTANGFAITKQHPAFAAACALHWMHSMGERPPLTDERVRCVLDWRINQNGHSL